MSALLEAQPAPVQSERDNPARWPLVIAGLGDAGLVADMLERDRVRFLHFLNSDCRSVGNATFGIQAPPKPDVEKPASATAAAAQKLAGAR